MKFQLKKSNVLWIALILLLTVSSCATQSMEPVQKAPGFLHGLFHGFTIFFSFIGSFFTDYEIYAFPNTGGWYNFGFMIGASMFFGGSGGAAGHGRRNKNSDFDD
jgi:hypothetical protein